MYTLNIRYTSVKEQVGNKTISYHNVYFGPLHVGRIYDGKVVVKNIGNDDTYKVETEEEGRACIESLCEKFAESLYRKP
jgi:cobalamin biosynthesis protein CobD/CbiB